MTGAPQVRRSPMPSARSARWAIATTGLVAAVGATLLCPPQTKWIWNVSASAPLGLYRVEAHRHYAVGDLVAARVPRQWRSFASVRRYIPVNVPLIKRIAAADGDRLCATGSAILVNGNLVAHRRARDGAGRPMPTWSGCTTLRRGEFLLLMPAGASFDGRYFGPSREADLLGRAQLLWER